jgi:hypothetical protein
MIEQANSLGKKSAAIVERMDAQSKWYRFGRWRSRW